MDLHLNDERALVTALNAGIGIAADARDWVAVRTAFVDRRYVDYTSLNDGEPGERSTDEFVGGWKAVLSGFDATQHVIANHQVVVAEDRGSCVSHFCAQHRMDEGETTRIWELDGDYRHDLVRDGARWRADRMVMTWRFERGDRRLNEEAARRDTVRAN